ncbi:unnamed protein product [Phaeothamnion confervicola]
MTAAEESAPSLLKLCECVVDKTQPLGKRTHAAFHLRTIGSDEAAAAVAEALLGSEDSALLRHEFAYILGQMGRASVCPALAHVLADESDDCMVRHEAAEALGAIGEESSVELLRQYANDPVPEVSQTCQLALELIAWKQSHGESGAAVTPAAADGNEAGAVEADLDLDASPYLSVDPAPAEGKDMSIGQLRARLLDQDLSLFRRYRAMFSLRNRGGEAAALALADAFDGESNALFKHEVAYVLGQMAHVATAPALARVLRDRSEHRMVRHEAAEALGAIGGDDAAMLLREFQEDDVAVVKESCDVALDTIDYWSGFSA